MNVTKLIYTIPVLLIGTTSVQAQTCVSPPSCTELGYTKTTTQCSGKSMIKCPFDQNKVMCEDNVLISCETLGFTDAIVECPGEYTKCPSDSSKGKCILEARAGDIKYSLRSSNHNGWLLCNGSYYAVDQYPELAAVIQPIFGTYLPNYSGYFLKSAATSATSTLKTAQSAGLPNIKGQIMSLRNEGVNVNGAISMTYGSASGKHSSGGSIYTFTLDASQYNSIYGNSTTVTPANYSVNTFIYTGKKKY